MAAAKREVLTREQASRLALFRERYGSETLYWNDGWGITVMGGVIVPKWVASHPERITIDSIHQKQNLEVRRVMIEAYGISRYVKDVGFRVVHKDLDPLGLPRRLLRQRPPPRPGGMMGTVWKPPPRDELLLVVELTNSTLDADGTRRIYHTPCHPRLCPLMPSGFLGPAQKLTCHNAVASTYGFLGEQYNLTQET